MAIKLAELAVMLKAQGTDGVRKDFDSIGKEAKKLQRNVMDLVNPANAVKAALAGLAAGFTTAAIGTFLKSAIDEARDAEDHLSQLRIAVENTGASFEATNPHIEEAVNNVQKLTRYSDDAARGALTTMISITGNVAGSIKNLSVVTGLAALKHIDLQQAAELVGKAMIGNVTALGKMGIKVKEGADIMQKLRDVTKGYAESDARTLTGQLDQTTNAWADVKQAIGEAILGTGDITRKTNGLRDALVDLKTYIEDNTTKWRGWAKNMLDEHWGPAQILNDIAEAANRAGLALHGMGQGDFGKKSEASGLLEAIGLHPTSYDEKYGHHAGGGGGGGGRDTPTGTPTLAPAVAYAPPPETKNGLDDEAGAAAKASKALQERIQLLGKALPFEDLRARSQRELASIEQTLRNQILSGNLSLEKRIDLEEKLATVQDLRAQKFISTQLPTSPQVTEGASPGTMAGRFDGPLAQVNESIAAKAQGGFQKILDKQVGTGSVMQGQIDQAAETIRGKIGQTLGDAIYNGFSAAFDGKGVGGVISAFGKTILAGLGDIFAQQGQALVTYGLTMIKLTPFLTNLFTSGPAALAAGFALIGLGAAFGAAARGGGGRGTAAAGSFRERSFGEEMTRLKFVDRSGNAVEERKSIVVNATIIGPDDPRAQRDITQLIKNAGRRAA